MPHYITALGKIASYRQRARNSIIKRRTLTNMKLRSTKIMMRMIISPNITILVRVLLLKFFTTLYALQLLTIHLANNGITVLQGAILLSLSPAQMILLLLLK